MTAMVLKLTTVKCTLCLRASCGSQLAVPRPCI